MVRAGVDIFFRPSVRRQLAAEIEAQFAAFAATGLPLDHVNAHKHFHLHPTIASLIIGIGQRYGLRAARAPVEPRSVLEAVEPAPGALSERIAAPWARRVRGRFRAHGLTAPDQVFGLAWTGRMNAPRLAGLIRHLPPGLSEIYLHPATGDAFPGHAAGYSYRAELAALTDPGTREAVRSSGARLGCFADFAHASRPA
jgi:hopanoid biosynthesis associated protein HpnK